MYCWRLMMDARREDGNSLAKSPSRHSRCVISSIRHGLTGTSTTWQPCERQSVYSTASARCSVNRIMNLVVACLQSRRFEVVAFQTDLHTCSLHCIPKCCRGGSRRKLMGACIVAPPNRVAALSPSGEWRRQAN